MNIQVHFAIKHSNECKLYRCTKCDSVFRSEVEWGVHVRVNHLQIAKPYRFSVYNILFPNTMHFYIKIGKIWNSKCFINWVVLSSMSSEHLVHISDFDFITTGACFVRIVSLLRWSFSVTWPHTVGHSSVPCVPSPSTWSTCWINMYRVFTQQRREQADKLPPTECQTEPHPSYNTHPLSRSRLVSDSRLWVPNIQVCIDFQFKS